MVEAGYKTVLHLNTIASYLKALAVAGGAADDLARRLPHDADTIMKTVRNGANGHIIKPVRNETLKKELAKLGLTPVDSVP